MSALNLERWLQPFTGSLQMTGTRISAAGVCILIVLNVPRTLAADDPAATRPRDWSAAASLKSQTPSIQFITADTPTDGASNPAADPSVAVQTDPSQNESRSGREEHPPNPLVQESSLTDQLKKALQQERDSRGLSPTPLTPTPDLPSSVATPDAIARMTAALQSDLESPDPRKREKAQRLLKLKQQLLRFRSQIQAGTANVAVDHKADDVAGADHGESTHRPTTESTGQHNAMEASDEPHVQIDDTNPLDDATDEHTIPQPSQTDHAVNPHQSAPDREQRPSPQRTTVKSSGIDHAVVDGPIDRLGLANNLYAVGDYLLALEMYEQADLVTMTSQQQIWTEYQIANCLRRTGKTAEASNRYRRIANQPEAGWLRDQSQWWVDVLEQMRIIQKGLDRKLETEPTHGQLDE